MTASCTLIIPAEQLLATDIVSHGKVEGGRSGRCRVAQIQNNKQAALTLNAGWQFQMPGMVHLRAVHWAARAAGVDISFQRSLDGEGTRRRQVAQSQDTSIVLFMLRQEPTITVNVPDSSVLTQDGDA